MGTSTLWGPVIAATIAAAGTAAATMLGPKPKANKPAGPMKEDVPGPDEARQRIEQEEMLKKRRGLTANINEGAEQVATTQSGARTLLG